MLFQQTARSKIAATVYLTQADLLARQQERNVQVEEVRQACLAAIGHSAQS
jgi:hypothetical protein